MVQIVFNNSSMDFKLSDMVSILSKPLPGLEAQLRMAPPYRIKELRDSQLKMISARESAVLILLYRKDNEMKTVVIRRSEYIGHHSGQIAFPGGKRESFDVDFTHTALREAHEEIGIAPNDIEILGQLTDLYLPPSNFFIKVFVGFHSSIPQFILNVKEVQSIIEIDLEELLDTKNIVLSKFLSSTTRLQVNAPCYAVQGIQIWGATAMIISEFAEVITQLLKQCELTDN
jgi:8-oxo-dGTP pyrophosphatase MutT (NUDIX family)